MGLRIVDRSADAIAETRPVTAGTRRQDDRSSVIGRLLLSGEISQREYNAGKTYADVALLYLETIGAPRPYGADTAGFSDDDALGAKVAYCEARDALRRAGRRCGVAVDRVCVYDEPPRDDAERHALRVGLRALG
jgi:hypothetical protein